MQEEILHPKLGDLHHEERTFGQRAADALTKFVGSWKFMFVIFIYVFIWLFLNITAYFQHWDPWPFILLNLTLSCLAALYAPVILMSQRRVEERNDKRLEYDYFINRKSFRRLEDVQSDLHDVHKAISRIEEKLNRKR